MGGHRGAYAMWLAIVMAILVTIAIDTAIIVLSNIAQSREPSVVISDLVHAEKAAVTNRLVLCFTICIQLFFSGGKREEEAVLLAL
jgi:hypothetical protein